MKFGSHPKNASLDDTIVTDKNIFICIGYTTAQRLNKGTIRLRAEEKDGSNSGLGLGGEEGRRKMLGAQIHIITAFNQVGDREGEIEIVGSSLGWDGMNG